MQAAVNDAAIASGVDPKELGTPRVTSVSPATTGQAATTKSPPPPAKICKKKFGHWCLDGTSLDKADVAGIIVGGCIFVILVAVAAAFLVLRMRRRAA